MEYEFLTISGRLKRALADPLYAAYQLKAWYAPESLMQRYAQHAHTQFCPSLCFVLSFDCDTAEDIAAAGVMHDRLLDMGVKPVYAVPGQLLQQGESTYVRIRETGAEFINHGFIEHTYFDNDKGRYASCFFYDQISQDQVKEDIFAADACLRDVLGIVPKGFRTPHFGTYQKPEHLYYLHGLLKQLDYDFSTSTSPYFSFRYGPLATMNGLTEIPVSGMGSAPLAILDSWACFAAPDRSLTDEDYFLEAERAGKLYQAAGVGVLNYYADPSHVYDKPEFFRAIEFWKSIAEPVTYRELLEKVNVVQGHRTV